MFKNFINGVPITFGCEEIIDNIKTKYAQYNEEFDRKQSQILAYHGEQFGSDGVELSAPDHVGVQGRQFSNEEFEKMQSGISCVDVDGKEYSGFDRPIGQWNCRHVTFPIIIGISERVHSDEQLQEMAENSERKYKLTQQQRAMETKLRTLKAQRIALSTAGDEIGAKQVQKKINEQQKAYRQFSEKNNLLYDTKRASVEGYSRISVKETDKVLNKSTNSDIISTVDENKAVKDVHYVGKINKDIYSCITKDIVRTK